MTPRTGANLCTDSEPDLHSPRHLHFAASAWDCRCVGTAIRDLREEAILEACATLAISFDEDPLWLFLVPEADKRRRWLPVIMAAALHDALPDGAVFVPEAGAGAGVMSLIPPGAYPTPTRRALGFLFRRKLRPDIPWPPWRLLRSGIGALRAVGRVHYREPHYYLPVIGVHPDHHGQGLGGALVRHAVTLAERDGVAIYLETANQSNLGFYRRATELASGAGGRGLRVWLRRIEAVGRGPHPRTGREAGPQSGHRAELPEGSR